MTWVTWGSALRLRPAILILTMSVSCAQTTSLLRPDPPIACSSCESWNAPQEPFRVFGNTYYVGTTGLSALLIDAGDRLILLDAALPQSAPVIDANIRRLGFRSEDIALITTSHEHFDHVGGIAAFQRASNAVVATSARGADALRKGEPTPADPQSRMADISFPSVQNVRVITDGEVIRVGSVELTGHSTPGHTPGGMSWSWQSCEGSLCLNVVYADSLNAVSRDGFRFSGDATSPSIVDEFRRSIAKVESLRCDIIVSVHPGFTGIGRR